MEGIFIFTPHHSPSIVIRPSLDGFNMVGPEGDLLPPLLLSPLFSLQPNKGLKFSLQPSPSLHLSLIPNTALIISFEQSNES